MGMDKAIEEIIKKAMENGDFDNLAGKGLPLRLNDDPNVPEDMRMTFHILQNSGVTLPWIETAREIETELQSARRDASLARRDSRDSADWKRHAGHFIERIEAINRLIIRYNYQVPSERLQRPQLNPERELAAIENQELEPPKTM